MLLNCRKIIVSVISDECPNSVQNSMDTDININFYPWIRSMTDNSCNHLYNCEWIFVISNPNSIHCHHYTLVSRVKKYPHPVFWLVLWAQRLNTTAVLAQSFQPTQLLPRVQEQTKRRFAVGVQRRCLSIYLTSSEVVFIHKTFFQRRVESKKKFEVWNLLWLFI
jgi:hypothetical protein